MSVAEAAIFLTREKLFLQEKCSICVPGTGLVPIYLGARLRPTNPGWGSLIPLGHSMGI